MTRSSGPIACPDILSGQFYFTRFFHETQYKTRNTFHFPKVFYNLSLQGNDSFSHPFHKATGHSSRAFYNKVETGEWP